MSDMDPEIPEVPVEIREAVEKMTRQIKEMLEKNHPEVEIEFVNVSLDRIDSILEQNKLKIAAAGPELHVFMEYCRDHRDEVDIDDPRWETAGEYMRSAALFWTAQDIKLAAATPDDEEMRPVLEMGPKLMEWLDSVPEPRAPRELRERLLNLTKDRQTPFRSPPGAVEWVREYVLAHYDQLPEEGQRLMHDTTVSWAALWLVPEGGI